MPAPYDPVRNQEWRKEMSDRFKLPKINKPLPSHQLSIVNGNIPKPKRKISYLHRMRNSKSKKGKRCKPLTIKHILQSHYKLECSYEFRMIGAFNSESDDDHTELIPDPSYKKTHHTRKHREKISKSMMGKHAGSKHPRWNGGSSFKPYCQKFNNDLKERVRAFFNYTCVKCGRKQTYRRLDVHHVNFDKMVCCNDTKPLFVPLCRKCHMKTMRNSSQEFEDFLTLNYNGKCFYTQDEVKLLNITINIPLKKRK